MVLKYAKDGNLRNYFKKIFHNLKWDEKLGILFKILDDLCDIQYMN